MSFRILRERISRIVSALLLTAGLAAGDADASELLDPLPVRDGFLLTQGFLQPGGWSAEIPESQWKLEVTSTSANSFAKSRLFAESLRELDDEAVSIRSAADQFKGPLFVVDGEVQTTTFRAVRSYGDGFRFAIDLPVVSYHGGWADEIIEGFHEAFELRDDERPFASQDDYFVRVPGRTFDASNGMMGSEIGDVAVHGAWSRPYRGSETLRWGIVTSLELPTGDASTLRGSGSPDASIGLMASRTGRRLTAHASAFMTRLGEHETLGTPAQFVSSGSAGIGWKATGSTALLLQAGTWESPLRDLGFEELSDAVWQVTVALRHMINDRTAIHIAVGENVKSFENSSDLVVQIGLTKRSKRW